MEYMNMSFFLFIILVALFFLRPDFFETMYNKVGRFIILISLIIISLNSLLLGILFIIIIIFLSQNKKTVNPVVKKNVKESVDDQLTIEEVVKKTIDKNSNEKFLYKKYDKNLYRKSKRENGVNVVQVSELMRPKSSKIMVVFPNTPNIKTIPYSKENYYKI